MKVHQELIVILNLEWLYLVKGEMIASVESASIVSSSGDYVCCWWESCKFDQGVQSGEIIENAIEITENAPKEIVKQEIR